MSRRAVQVNTLTLVQFQLQSQPVLEYQRYNTKALSSTVSEGYDIVLVRYATICGDVVASYYELRAQLISLKLEITFLNPLIMTLRILDTI